MVNYEEIRLPWTEWKKEIDYDENGNVDSYFMSGI